MEQEFIVIYVNPDHIIGKDIIFRLFRIIDVGK